MIFRLWSGMESASSVRLLHGTSVAESKDTADQIAINSTEPNTLPAQKVFFDSFGGTSPQILPLYYGKSYPSPASLRTDVLPRTRNDASGSISLKDSKRANYYPSPGLTTSKKTSSSGSWPTSMATPPQTSLPTLSKKNMSRSQSSSSLLSSTESSTTQSSARSNLTLQLGIV